MQTISQRKTLTSRARVFYPPGNRHAAKWVHAVRFLRRRGIAMSKWVMDGGKKNWGN